MTFEWIEMKKDLAKKVIEKGHQGKRPRFWSQIDGKVIKFQPGTEEGNPIADTTEQLSMFRIGVAHDEWSRILELCLQLMDEREASPIPCWEVSEVIQVSKQLKEQEVRLIKQLADNRENKDEEAEVLKKDVTALVASIYNNLAACQLLEANYRHVLHLCDQVLKRAPSDPKAIYRKASALLGLRQFQDSLETVKMGLVLDPSNKAMQSLEKKANNYCIQQRNEFAKGMKKFFH
ncbi:FK506-binding protein-like [Daphnia pulex]|uniref:FK506-binding protein-like n=1 Tax=Daphnia pulex TaxID=6669 RepID=UPI001EDEB463|nr:FK506-binding protein-like [Daphnia pulex]